MALGRVVNAVAIVAVGVADQMSHGGWSPLYSIPVALSGVCDGWRGGLAAAVLSAVLLVSGSTEPGRQTFVPVVALLGVGAATGWLAGRERRHREHYQKLAGQLSSVYEKVQANFEGMKRAERLSAIGQLSAGLAHEIRNPLASIAGAAAILQRNQNEGPKKAKCIDIITSECQRLNGLLTNFLDFARPRPPRFQSVELESVLDNVLTLAAHGVRGKTVAFEKQVEAGLPRVECDPEQLGQVLLNLMINAIEASPEGGTVTLSAASDERRIAVRVVDHGDGVAPAHVDRLFDPFFTTKEHGTGLGLPVAHQIVRQMGGSLMAERNEIRGMTFSVILPGQHPET